MQFAPARIFIAVLAFIVGAVLALPMLVSRKVDTAEAVPPATDAVALARAVQAAEAAVGETDAGWPDRSTLEPLAGLEKIPDDGSGAASGMLGYAALLRERVDAGKRLDEALLGGPRGLRRPADTGHYRVEPARFEPRLPAALRLFEKRRYHLRT